MFGGAFVSRSSLALEMMLELRLSMDGRIGQFQLRYRLVRILHRLQELCINDKIPFDHDSRCGWGAYTKCFCN